MVTAAIAAGGCATFLEDPFLVSPQRSGTATPATATGSEPSTAGTTSSSTVGAAGSSSATSTNSATPIAEDTVDFTEPDGGISGIAGAGGASGTAAAPGPEAGTGGQEPVTGGSGGETADPAEECDADDGQTGDCTIVQLQLAVVADSGDWGAQADIGELVDGDTSGAVWATAGEAWVEIEIDIDGSALLTRLTIDSGAASGMTFQLLYFDGEDFVEATDEVAAGEAGSTEVTLDPVVADRVRVVFSGDSSGSGSFGGGFQGGGGGGGAPIVVQEIRLFGVLES